MKDDVLSANAAFYQAIRNGDTARMETLWAAQRPVSCTHPGWSTLTGRRPVMESWRALLTEQEPPELWPSGACAVVTGGTALVICLEQIDGVELMACNGFVWEDGTWRLTDHQAAPVSAAQAG